MTFKRFKQESVVSTKAERSEHIIVNIESDDSDDDDVVEIVRDVKNLQVGSRHGITFHGREFRPGPNARPYTGVTEMKPSRPFISDGRRPVDLLRESKLKIMFTCCILHGGSILG